MSMITTHVLDTSRGKPASGISIMLFIYTDEVWQSIAGGTTNTDGRLTGLLEKNTIAAPGTYKLKFETKEYFDTQSIETFYPFVEIIFDIKDATHCHVPLLLNPFGYSTYRGS